MGYNKNACLKTIAYELNLSINTVSRALRDCDDISAKTKEKVRKTALEMGYLPNRSIASLNNGESKLIALVINNIKNYYFTAMSEKLIYNLRKEGYVVVIISLYGNALDIGIVKECMYQRVDGIISFVEPEKDALDVVKLNKIPFLLLGRKIDDEYCDMIYTNDIAGGEMATKYLYKCNCKNYIYVNVNGSECATRRYNGFKNYLRNTIKTYKYKKINIEDFKDNLEYVKSLENLGIFCYNDEHAYIVIDILKKNNIDLSKIKFIGYDDIYRQNLGLIYIPSIGFDYEAIATTAVNLMITRCKQHREKISVCFDVNLIGDEYEVQ